MSQFIESIKVEDQDIFLLELHQKRVNQTFAHFEKRVLLIWVRFSKILSMTKTVCSSSDFLMILIKESAPR